MLSPLSQSEAGARQQDQSLCTQDEFHVDAEGPEPLPKRFRKDSKTLVVQILQLLSGMNSLEEKTLKNCLN